MARSKAGQGHIGHTIKADGSRSYYVKFRVIDPETGNTKQVLKRGLPPRRRHPLICVMPSSVPLRGSTSARYERLCGSSLKIGLPGFGSRQHRVFVPPQDAAIRDPGTW